MNRSKHDMFAEYPDGRLAAMFPGCRVSGEGNGIYDIFSTEAELS